MKIYLATVAIAAITISTPAQAEDFVVDIAWGDVEMTGGVGPEANRAMAGVVEGTYTVTYADGQSGNGNIRCVGMDTPPSEAPFQLRMSCDASREGLRTSMAFNCLWRGEPGNDTPLFCIGFMTGREGAFAGRGGMMTLDWPEPNTSHGTGQWWPAQG